MPVFEFECKKCKNIHSTFVWQSEDTETIECPKCHTKKSKKLISRSHLGWGKMLKAFTKAEDDRAEAKAKSHMGPNPYEAMPDEQDLM